MLTAYWHKPDFSVVMCLSRQVDSLSIADAQDNGMDENSKSWTFEIQNLK